MPPIPADGARGPGLEPCRDACLAEVVAAWQADHPGRGAQLLLAHLALLEPVRGGGWPLHACMRVGVSGLGERGGGHACTLGECLIWRYHIRHKIHFIMTVVIIISHEKQKASLIHALGRQI